MKQPLQIHFLGMQPSGAVEAAVRQKVEHLERFCPDLMSCRVAVELLQKHQHQGRPYGVCVDLTWHGHELVINRVQHEDVYVALREAFDDMKRQIEDVIRKRRDQERQAPGALQDEVPAEVEKAQRVSQGKNHAG